MKCSSIIVLAGLSLILAIPFTPIPDKDIQAAKVVQPHKVTAESTPMPTVIPQPNTPPPTPIPQPSTAPVEYATYPTGCAGYAELIDQYPWDHATAEAICQAESGGDPTDVSPPDSDGLNDYGLFQIHGEAIFNPAANVARAYQKYIDQGWHAWSTYNSGKYLQFLE